MKKSKTCKNCKFAVIREKADSYAPYAPNVICMKRTNFEKGKVYLTWEDANCRNYFSPIGGEENGSSYKSD